jgi:deoxyribodipyrimidine photo-lyase
MPNAPKRTIFWFRRDLRLADNPALLAAIAESDEIIPLFIIDDAIAQRAGEFRRAYLADSLRKLDESLNGALHVISGDPVKVLQDLSARFNSTSVHVAQDFAPYGVARDARVESAGITLTKTGSWYAVSPGRVQKGDGTPYRVYTPFFKAWSIHGWRAPVKAPKVISTVEARKEDRQFPDWKISGGVVLQSAGELAAHERWKEFRKSGLSSYDQNRNLSGIDGTSKLSPHLRWGEIHPRTLLADLDNSEGHMVFRKEIAWREFYADVLHHNPHTTREYYAPRFANMRYDEPGEKFKAWCEGKTGYPFVDAAMRQLLAEGWMHNRTRMVVASFLVKDLHLEWQHGANFFMKYLIDNDVASNSHGWQWTAGCGTDASPYYRIFNPIEQGKRFDEQGIYIRKYIPELRHLSDKEIHEPWDAKDGYLHGYPQRIVDHSVERNESLARLKEIKVDSPES